MAEFEQRVRTRSNTFVDDTASSSTRKRSSSVFSRFNPQERRGHGQSADRPLSWHSSGRRMTSSHADTIPQRHELRRASTIAVAGDGDIRASIKKRALRFSGEHDIAARYKARIKDRPDIDPARGCRRHSSASINNTNMLTGEVIRGATPHSLSLSVRNLTKSSTQHGQSRALPSIPASPFGLDLQDPWHEDHVQIARRKNRRQSGLIDSLVSPLSRHAPPSMLSSVPPKGSPVVRQHNITAQRKTKDISHFPASAKWYFWHLYIDGHAPFVLTSLQVHRRPSKRPTKSEPSQKRKFNRNSGFWS